MYIHIRTALPDRPTSQSSAMNTDESAPNCFDESRHSNRLTYYVDCDRGYCEASVLQATRSLSYDNHRDAHRPRPQGRVSVESMTLKEAYSVPKHTSAICVQSFDDSLNSAIHITYRISLRSSSLREPRYPLLRVLDRFDSAHRNCTRTAAAARTHTISDT